MQSRLQLLDTPLTSGDCLLLRLKDRLLLAVLGTELGVLSLQFVDAIVPKGTCHNPIRNCFAASCKQAKMFLYRALDQPVRAVNAYEISTATSPPAVWIAITLQLQESHPIRCPDPGCYCPLLTVAVRCRIGGLPFESQALLDTGAAWLVVGGDLAGYAPICCKKSSVPPGKR